MTDTVVTIAAPAGHTWAVHAPPAVEVAAPWRPDELLPGWTCDGTTITVPRASLYGLSAAAADPVSGDAREVILAMVRTAQDYLNRLETKPAALTCGFSGGAVSPFGDFAGNTQERYTISAHVSVPGRTLAGEP